MNTTPRPAARRKRTERRLRAERRLRGEHRLRAFTLVEIMMVVAIMGVLLAAFAPNLARAREAARARACVTNLKQIDSVKEQYSLENRLTNGASIPALSSLVGTTPTLTGGYLKSLPLCPSNPPAGYTPGVVGVAPTCPIGPNVSAAAFDDHILPQ